MGKEETRMRSFMGRSGEVIGWEFGIDMYMLLHLV